MPAEGIHLTALREATSAAGLSTPARRLLVRHGEEARLGALLVDLPYFYRFAAEVMRYVAKRPPRPSRWGAELHRGGAVTLLYQLVEQARQAHDSALGAIALGLVSHLAIDRALHPLVNSLARRYPVGSGHDAAHREVEKFQSICFHERYMGRDLMGTAALTGYLDIPALALVTSSAGVEPLRRAWQAALGEAPSARELADCARGYRMHIRLIGSPLGKRIAPAAAKEAARPRYLHGAWGTFEQALERAVAASLAVLDAAAAALEATDLEAGQATAALAAALPPGTIDPSGTEDTLEQPFEPALGLATS